nr:MAG TPA: hypothetical protein [Caudoviricetes sp.]
MKAMRFTFPQLNVSIFQLDKGMDAMICLNERQVIVENPEGISETMYEYDGNIFRTFKLTEKEIIQEPEKYLDYKGDTEPTEEMTQYANEMIDAYTEQLISEGVIA